MGKEKSRSPSKHAAAEMIRNSGKEKVVKSTIAVNAAIYATATTFCCFNLGQSVGSALYNAMMLSYLPVLIVTTLGLGAVYKISKIKAPNENKKEKDLKTSLLEREVEKEKGRDLVKNSPSNTVVPVKASRTISVTPTFISR